MLRHTRSFQGWVKSRRVVGPPKNGQIELGRGCQNEAQALITTLARASPERVPVKGCGHAGLATSRLPAQPHGAAAFSAPRCELAVPQQCKGHLEQQDQGHTWGRTRKNQSLVSQPFP